jgi:hypothetical protein
MLFKSRRFIEVLTVQGKEFIGFSKCMGQNERSEADSSIPPYSNLPICLQRNPSPLLCVLLEKSLKISSPE